MKPKSAIDSVPADKQDDLEDYIAEQVARNPEFPRLMADAADRKRLLRELANARQQRGLSQTAVAAAMSTSTSAVARLEAGAGNPTIGTIQRFAAATGSTFTWSLHAVEDATGSAKP